mgnify:CR=1 FL=1
MASSMTHALTSAAMATDTTPLSLSSANPISLSFMATFKALYATQADKKTTVSFQQLDTSAFPSGEVLIRVKYSSLNYKDGLAVTGRPGVIRQFPMVPGIDLAGVVAQPERGSVESRHPKIILPVVRRRRRHARRRALRFARLALSLVSAGVGAQRQCAQQADRHDRSHHLSPSFVVRCYSLNRCVTVSPTLQSSLASKAGPKSQPSPTTRTAPCVSMRQQPVVPPSPARSRSLSSRSL